MDQWLVAGLGNPGDRYARTRHNAGAMVADLLAIDAEERFRKARFVPVETAEIAIDGRKTWLAKSLRFMNESGPSYASIAKKHDVTPDHVIAVHDEIDLPFGALKVKIGGSTAGHNGLKSLQQSLRTPDFLRVRVGVGRPPGRQDPADYVLQPFAKREEADVAILIDAAADAVRSAHPLRARRHAGQAQPLRRPRLMERVILTRHAESVFNVRGVLNGDPSIPGGLTEEGRAQGRRLGERLVNERIDLCVTTEFERTRETADIALAGRNVPRAIVPDLNDPPAGDLEQRPYAELARWREVNGPDIPIPGLVRTERDYFETVERGFRRLVERPEPTVLAVLHGYVVTWILSCAGATMSGGYAEEFVLTAPELLDALDAAAGDVFRHWSWETSGRPLLLGVDEDD